MPTTDGKLRVLFLCTGNACRSQMAEGWARELKGDVIEPHSAGVIAHGLDPRAAQVMSEAGVDISGHRSKRVTDFADEEFDYVVAVCDHAANNCPVFPGKATVVRHGFDDPPSLAAVAVSETAALAQYRRVRDEIRDFIQTLPEALSNRGES